MTNRYLLHFFLFFSFAIGAQSTLASEAAYTCKFEIERFWQDAKPSTRKGNYITASGDAVINGNQLELENVKLSKRVLKRVGPSVVESQTSLNITVSGGIVGHLTIPDKKSGKNLTDFHIGNPEPKDDKTAKPPIKGVYIEGNAFKASKDNIATFIIRRAEWTKYTGDYTRYELRLIDCLDNLQGHVAQLVAQNDTVQSGAAIPSDDSGEKFTATTSNSVVEPSNSESQAEIDEQISILLKETQSLKAQLSEATNLASARLQSIQDLEGQLAELQKAADVSASDSEKNSELTQQITQMTQMLLDREQRIKELNEKVAALEDSSSDVNEAINTKLMQMVAKLETSQASLIAELDEAKVALEAEKAKVASLSALEQQVASCEADKVRTIEELNAKQSNVVSALKEKIAEYAVKSAMCETGDPAPDDEQLSSSANTTEAQVDAPIEDFVPEPMIAGYGLSEVREHSKKVLEKSLTDIGFRQEWVDKAWADQRTNALYSKYLSQEQFGECKAGFDLYLIQLRLQILGGQSMQVGFMTHFSMKVLSDALNFREVELKREIGNKKFADLLQKAEISSSDDAAAAVKKCFPFSNDFLLIAFGDAGERFVTDFVQLWEGSAAGVNASSGSRAPGCTQYHENLLTNARNYFNIPTKNIKECNREIGYSTIYFDDYSSLLHWGENVLGYKSSQLGNYQCVDLFTNQRFYGKISSCNAR